jgi:hypothetical protein
VNWIGEPLEFMETDNPDYFELSHEFGFKDRYDTLWVAPKGTITDGASIPAAFWLCIGNPMQGEYRRAAILHDFYYQTHERSKEWVDRMFYDAMIFNGTNSCKAYVMWKAVSWFGGFAWKSKGRR